MPDLQEAVTKADFDGKRRNTLQSRATTSGYVGSIAAARASTLGERASAITQ